MRADLHEQRKPWVPLMLEAAYRPKGWLGIMLGSRLYYEFTGAALSTVEEWERVADGVSQEVRRQGAPPPSSHAQAAEARPKDSVEVAAAVAPAVPTWDATAAGGPRAPPMREATVGVRVSSVVLNSNATNNYSNSNSNSNIGNIGNTSIVLM